MHYPSTRVAAWSRWEEFLPALPLYGRDRNDVQAEHGNVSRLSPAIRCRLILEEEVIQASLSKHSLTRIEKFVQEVYWRSYWKGWLESRPKVWSTYRAQLSGLKENLSPELALKMKRVEEGQSGVAIMDYFAQQLVETGYLHNHARMWFASFWIHVERLPWELGADFFYRNLLDADPASNTLSWRWVAGLQTPGKTYLVRRSNIEKYVATELLQNGKGLDRLEDDHVEALRITEPHPPVMSAPEAWPTSLGQLNGRVGLWLHGEDLCPESSELQNCKVVDIVAVSSAFMRQNFGLSQNRRDYMREATLDGLKRAELHYGVPARLVEVETLAEGLKKWAAESKLDVVIGFAPYVGPLHDALNDLKTALKTIGVTLVLIRRKRDAELIPLAQRGFFPFWEKVQRTLKVQVQPSGGQKELF